MRIILCISVLCLFLVFSCDLGDHGGPGPQKPLSLESGDYYFTCSGKVSFVYGKNATGSVDQISSMIGWQQEAGGKFLRIHITHGFGMGITSSGGVDPAFLSTWDSVFEKAAQAGISVIPVFGVWADFNDDGFEWSNWVNNPLNQANGGPGVSPVELFQDTDTQALWLGWMTELVAHWQSRWNIAAWEVFSELDLATGANEALVTAFFEKAAACIKAADQDGRPVTASLVNFAWNSFYQSPALEIVQIHPYNANLDTTILGLIPAMRTAYNKPVLIGESGLSAANPETPGDITTDPRAGFGIWHAVWAALVSGAMNGRSLWWEDAYAVYHPTLGFDFVSGYAKVEENAAQFIEDVDYMDFTPVSVVLTAGIKGGVIGEVTTCYIGWFRDAACEPPLWPVVNVTAQTVTFNVPGNDRDGTVYFYDPNTGGQLGSQQVSINGNSVTIDLPDFSDSIAFKLVPDADSP